MASSALPDELTTGVPLVNSYVNGGIVGVADELTTGVPLVNSYVNGGIVGVADELTTGVPLVNSYVNGGIVGVADELTTGVPLVNSYVNGGIVGVADELTTGVPLVNSYVNGGIVGLADELTAGVPAVNAYIAGYPLIRDPDGNVVVAGPNGILGLTQFLVDTLLGDPFPPSAEAGTEARVGAMLTATVNQDDTGLAGGPVRAPLVPRRPGRSRRSRPLHRIWAHPPRPHRQADYAGDRRSCRYDSGCRHDQGW